MHLREFRENFTLDTSKWKNKVEILVEGKCDNGTAFIEIVSYRQSNTESYLLVWNTAFYNETGSF